MSKREYFSIVIQIHDKEKSAEAVRKFTEAMAADLENFEKGFLPESGYSVVACGFGDFATQADAYGAELTNQGIGLEEVIQNYLEDTEEGVDDMVEAKAVLG